MKKTILLVASMIFLIGAASANATNITVNHTPGTQVDIIGTIESLAHDYDMYGMQVKVADGNGNLNTYVWGDLGATGSGVTLKDGGTLSLDGDSFGNPVYDTNGNFLHVDSWILNTVSDSIGYIIIDALSGNAVFDVWNPETVNGTKIYGTPGSDWGIEFGYNLDNYGVLSDVANITVTYSNLVGVGHDPVDPVDPVGDLYGQLKIEFGAGGFLPTNYLSFQADTDSVAPVPEPGTMLLLGLGLAGLIGYNRKRNGNKG